MADGLWVVGVVALEEHELRDGTLYRGVAAADDTSLLQMVTAVVTPHLHGTLHTLTDVDNHLAITRTLAQGVEQPGLLRGIARAEGAHDDGLEVGRVDDMTDEVFTDAREEREDDDIVVEAEVGHHGLVPVGLEDEVAMVGDVHASFDEMGKLNDSKALNSSALCFVVRLPRNR